MDNKAAKELWKQPIKDKGSFTTESKTATASSLVTTNEEALTSLTTKYVGTALQFTNGITNEVVWNDHFQGRKQGFSGHGASAQFVRKCQQKLGNGLNVWYLYKTTAVLENQEPSLIVPMSELQQQQPKEPTVAGPPVEGDSSPETNDAEKKTTEAPSEEKTEDATATEDDDLCKLYLYARFIPVKGTAGTASYVIYSTIKGVDTDCRESGAGFLWKDVYKVIKIPQFQYAALILDISEYSNKIVGKSQQKSAIDVRPTFDLASGVDLAAVVTACVPLLPEGSKVWLGASLANDLTGMLTAGLGGNS